MQEFVKESDLKLIFSQKHFVFDTFWNKEKRCIITTNKNKMQFSLISTIVILFCFAFFLSFSHCVVLF